MAAFFSIYPSLLTGSAGLTIHQRASCNQLLADNSFEAALVHCEACAASPHSTSSLSAEVPELLRRAFDADFEELLQANAHIRTVQNVTCMRPVESVDPKAVGCFNDELLQVPLTTGRICEGGVCSDACSRVHLPLLATPAECILFRNLADDFMKNPDEAPISNLHLGSAVAHDEANLRTTLLYVRFIERMRRAIALEYGLELATIRPRQTFVSRIIGHPDMSRKRDLHADEASFGQYHYSAVLYLNTHGEDFEGGRFVFSDPPPSDGQQHHALSSSGVEVVNGRALSPVEPTVGSAVLFSSGWENMHFVEPLTAGCRFSLPAFFTTQPAGGARCHDGNDGAIAETLWQTLLEPETEHDFAYFMENWHGLLV